MSVWLHQAVHGARDRAGQPLQSAHLALLFSRICKLLHYRIRPVFVFDGGSPALKQQTLVRETLSFCTSYHFPPHFPFPPSSLPPSSLPPSSLPPSPSLPPSSLPPLPPSQAQRSQRRQSAAKRGQKAEERQRNKYLQAKILEQLTGEKR